jgi:hypothetical protein
MRYLVVLPVCAILILSGCQGFYGPGDKEEMKREVLEKDPAFSEILSEKQEVDAQIAKLRAEFADKKREVSSKISGLKDELNFARKNSDIEIKNTDARLEPYRQDIKLRIKELLTELKLRKSSLATTRKMISKLGKLVEQKSVSEDLGKESAKWQDKITYMHNQAGDLEKEIAYIQDEIRLNRLKLKLLK